MSTYEIDFFAVFTMFNLSVLSKTMIKLNIARLPKHLEWSFNTCYYVINVLKIPTEILDHDCIYYWYISPVTKLGISCSHISS